MDGAAEGPNTLAFRAVDAAGNRTDSTRTVIRDTQAPVVTLNSLPDSATVRADSAVTVSGTITDLTKVTANVNGQPLAIDSVTHAFSRADHAVDGHELRDRDGDGRGGERDERGAADHGR